MLSFFTFGGNFVENIGKSKIIKRIHKAALSYNQYFLGKTYMFVYDNQFVEVLFKKSSFLHLTGVDTKLNAKDFHTHASRNQLRPKEIFFSNEHPFDLAVQKTACLDNLYKLTVTNSMITTDIVTATFSYELGVTNLRFIICLGDDVNQEGRMVSNCKIPYSFRIENIHNDKYGELHEVTHVFMKNTSNKKYHALTFGDKNSMKDLPEEVLKKIDLKE